jgi:hypothetical protein
MLALERYGHTLSCTRENGETSEFDRDAGLIARQALDEIRVVERRSGRSWPSAANSMFPGIRKRA